MVHEVLDRWPKNGLRHSFMTCHYEIHGAMETAKQAGRSKDILHAHYRELVTHKAAEEFWALAPEAVLAGK